MNDLQKARSILESGNHTCVLCKGDAVYISDKSGIAPMVGFISEGVDLKGFSVADKIVGKAAAMLFILAGIKNAYGEVMSIGGLEFLEQNGIGASYNVLTKKIINRSGTDICPMEKAVENISVPTEAFLSIKETIRKLKEAESK